MFDMTSTSPKAVSQNSSSPKNNAQASAAGSDETVLAAGFQSTPMGETLEAMNLYMREVGRTRLLTVEEEIELAARIKAGDESARERMICANLRLVIKIAREYEHLGLPLLDLVNEGNMGLMKAVEKFDPSKGGKFSTYSSWWIRQSVRRAVTNQSKTIRLPIHVVDKLCQMTRVAAKLKEIFGREATNEELADEMAISVRRIARLRKAAIATVSIDAPLGDDESQSLMEVVQDEATVSPDLAIESKNDLGRLSELVGRLDRRESAIIKSRFGLDGGSERTLEEIGAKMGVTRERIRQLQNSALKKLRRMLDQPSLEAQAAAA